MFVINFKFSMLFVSFIILSLNLRSQTTVTDVSGNIYKTVKIGNQIWMAENLRTEKFRNGDTVLEAKRHDEWIKATREERPAFCNYENNKENDLVYGKLYNGYVLNDSRGIAPEGWHIPTKEEWETLIKYLGKNSSKKIKSKTEDWGYAMGNNKSGFSARLAGHRNETGFRNTVTKFWSITESDDRVAYGVIINCGIYNPIIERIIKHEGCSIRCIKD
jgi:uncharacterized protein (TIGR02145 family)